jgi:hypothetical protein
VSLNPREQALEEKKDRNPPVLEYQPTSERTTQSLRMWIRWVNSGEDSFLACTALLLACMAWAVEIVAWLCGAGGTFACSGFAAAVFSALLALGGLIEPRTSKTFSLLSLAMDGIYGIGMAFIR